MADPVLCVLVPIGGSGLGGGAPSHPIHLPPYVWPSPPGQPPGIWGGMPWPTPPIAPGGTTPPWGIPLPPGASQGPGFPSHPAMPGGTTPPWGIALPPGASQGPGFPTHPIAPGGTTPPWGVEGPGEGGEGDQGGWAWSPWYGWVWIPRGSGGKPKPPGASSEPGGEAQPKA